VERLCKLLFELSSNERISIMLKIQRQRLKLSHISRKLNLTVTEASRHLKRLSEARLIQKGVDGLYGLTPFGVLVLSLLSSLGFVSKYRDYFVEYDVSRIPYEFIDRIGELAESEFGAETFRNLEETEKMFREARKFIWILSDQVLTSSAPTIAERVKGSFEYRVILQEAAMPPDSKSPIPSTTPGVQKRVLPKVDFVIVMTEKAAAFCLPNLSGRIDYTGFGGNDPKFHKWCKDLFLHYWKKAKPVGSTTITPPKNTKPRS
jgi:predicted transcriptional regulator